MDLPIAAPALTALWTDVIPPVASSAAQEQK